MKLEVTKHAYRRAKERSPYHSKAKIDNFAEDAYWAGKSISEVEDIKKEVKKTLIKRCRWDGLDIRVYRGYVFVFSIENQKCITIYGLRDMKEILEDGIGKTLEDEVYEYCVA